MSVCLSSRDGIKARKPHRCCLCGEGIIKGDRQDVRTGVQEGDGFWTMHMHPECHRYEQSASRPVDPDWYEEISDSAFPRAEAVAYVKTLVVFVCTEDEMVTFHKDGKYLETLYASCPEQAIDFAERHSKEHFTDIKQWVELLNKFRTTWKSKYPDED